MSHKDLRASYTDLAIELLQANPDMNASKLAKELKEKHGVSTHDLTMRNFWRELQRKLLNEPDPKLKAICEKHTSEAIRILSETPAINASDLRCKLGLLISDFMAEQFYQSTLIKLQKLKTSLSEDLANNIQNLTVASLLKILEGRSWSGDNQLLWKRLRCLKEWMLETQLLFSKTTPDPKAGVRDLKTMTQSCLDDSDFQLWAKLLSWKFCSRCGKRFPSPTDHLAVTSSCIQNCRQCDQTPDFMEEVRVQKKMCFVI